MTNPNVDKSIATPETEDSGPIKTSIWDTRTRENSRWCSGCSKWLALLAFSYLPTLEARLKYHQTQYCSSHPNFAPTHD